MYILCFSHCKGTVRVYRVSHLLVDLGWVDFDSGVPQSCPATSAQFPSVQAESGRQWNTQNSSHPNPVHEQMYSAFHSDAPWVVLMQWTPLVPFLARTTLSFAERNMYLMLLMVTPDCAIWSTLLYLDSKAFSSSTETWNNEGQCVRENQV